MGRGIRVQESWRLLVMIVSLQLYHFHNHNLIIYIIYNAVMGCDMSGISDIIPFLKWLWMT